jgi:hypothetical protein
VVAGIVGAVISIMHPIWGKIFSVRYVLTSGDRRVSGVGRRGTREGSFFQLDSKIFQPVSYLVGRSSNMGRKDDLLRLENRINFANPIRESPAGR